MAPMRALPALLVVVLTLLLAACSSGPGDKFRIVAGSENTVLEPIVAEFCKERLQNLFMRENAPL